MVVEHARLTVEAGREEEFRESERFRRRRALVGPFFAQPPAVEHHRQVSPR